MADDKKIIFSMVGVSKSFQNNKQVPEQQAGIERHLPILFLWSKNRYHRFERFR